MLLRSKINPILRNLVWIVLGMVTEKASWIAKIGKYSIIKYYKLTEIAWNN